MFANPLLLFLNASAYTEQYLVDSRNFFKTASEDTPVRAVACCTGDWSVICSQARQELERGWRLYRVIAAVENEYSSCC